MCIIVPISWLNSYDDDGYEIIYHVFQALAAEMAPDTRVNAVAPGFVPTHFASFITGSSEVVML